MLKIKELPETVETNGVMKIVTDTWLGSLVAMAGSGRLLTLPSKMTKSIGAVGLALSTITLIAATGCIGEEIYRKKVVEGAEDEEPN